MGFDGCDLSASKISGDCLMVKTSVENLDFRLGSRDAGLASALALLPGLGQIYNGQARKGLLFLAITGTYIFVFLLIIFNHGLIDFLTNFGLAFHMKPDTDLISVLSELHAGSTVSFVVLALFVGFVVYAIKDAYQYAGYIHSRYIYTDYAMEMTEATSGSYLLHFIGIIILFLLAVYYLQHTHPLTQTTVIEFVPEQLATKMIVRSKTASTKSSNNSGLHKNQTVIAPSHQTQNTAKTTPPVKPQFHLVQAQTTATKLMPLTPVSHVIPNRPPLPAPTAPDNLHVASPPINPSINQTNNQTKSINPQPTPSEKNKSAQGFKPHLNGSPALLSSNNGLVPGPVPASGSSTNKYNPAPIAGGASPSGKNSTGTLPSGIRPIYAGGLDSNRPGGIVIQPVLPAGITPGRGATGENTAGNPPINSREQGPTSVESIPVDFSAYMNDLQRRIKRVWSPPKGTENATVVVLFKIHKAGQLSHLRLNKSSGIARADEAALKAIEDAAPFRQLPKGSPDDVDIQFTFDYTVFNGSRALRNF